jgi:hypothetical protein
MEIVAHGLWAAAAVVAARRSTARRISLPWTIWWAAFPDTMAFGPSVAYGAWLWTTGRLAAFGGHRPRVNLGFPVYPAVHSLVVFAIAFAVVSAVARRPVLPMLGWLMHILIDIPTHSFSYYATRFLWPLSDFRVDGIAWWTPWFWAATYAALAVVYVLMWRKGWFRRPLLS